MVDFHLELCAAVKLFAKENVASSEIHERLESAYGQNVPHYSTIESR